VGDTRLGLMGEAGIRNAGSWEGRGGWAPGGASEFSLRRAYSRRENHGRILKDHRMGNCVASGGTLINRDSAAGQPGLTKKRNWVEETRGRWLRVTGTTHGLEKSSVREAKSPAMAERMGGNTTGKGLNRPRDSGHWYRLPDMQVKDSWKGGAIRRPDDINLPLERLPIRRVGESQRSTIPSRGPEGTIKD